MTEIGTIVHFVVQAGPSRGEHRAAIVVTEPIDGRVNLQVFIDGSNDGYPHSRAAIWEQGVPYSEGMEPGTWHEIETEEPLEEPPEEPPEE